MGQLDGKTIVVGITGGIAAYKACYVVSALKKMGACVHVIMTKNACEFVRPLTFQTLSNNPVVTDTFAPPVYFEVEHVALAKKADLFLICPATANIMAKFATGLADDMLSTTVLATKARVLLAPAMNTGMWENPATRQNVRTLAERGFLFVGPEGGHLACGDSGVGRMSEPEEIVQETVRILCSKNDLAGMKVLVTAGATREKIDPVRFLTNRSTGKMGYAIAEMARLRGAEVTLVSGVCGLPVPQGVECVFVESTEDLCEAMVRLAPMQDVVIQAAAPADFTPACVSDRKIKKNGKGQLTLELVSTPDVARTIGQNKKSGQIFVGFAAETESVTDNAAEKLERKNLDLICANDVTQPGAGFGVDTNIVTLIDRYQKKSCPLMSKQEVAQIILDRVLELRKEAKG